LFTFDFPEECGHVLIVERQRAAQQRVQDDAARPDVHFRSGVQLAGNDFRRRVVRRAAAGTNSMKSGANPTTSIDNVNFYDATSSLVRFENKNMFFYFEKRSTLLQRWRCR
jgi:hypothetical protein